MIRRDLLPRLSALVLLAAPALALGDPALPLGDPAAAPLDPSDDGAIDFDRDVRPLLSDRCFTCHGPDAAERKAGLRLDTEEGARAALRHGGHALVPGDPEASELWRRVSTDDPGERMPPEETGKTLDADELDLLRRWIEAGAPWAEHWAFRAPERAPLPEVARADWPRHDLDRFVLARMEAAGLAPEPEADRATLLRRVTLDLTGLPPTAEELDAFLADERPDAYERVVDRLLESPRRGEHLARFWLDAARYADTHGLHLDNERSMWPYRQWVIEAFNRNLPLDEFTVEQLAGDLLPDATQDQKVASGFNRCNPTSAEGGMIAEEYLSIYAKDRVDTTATVFLGLTLGCAKCHDHKYDPLTARDYYSMTGFFNSFREEATDRNIPNPEPFLRVATEEQRARLDDLAARADEQRATLERPWPEVDAAQAEWERDWTARLAGRWRVLTPTRAEAERSSLEVREDASVLAVGEAPANDVYVVEAYSGEERIRALLLEALCDPAWGTELPGRATNRNFVLTGIELEAWPADGSAPPARVPLVEARATWSQQNGFPVEHALDDDPNTGWAGLGFAGDRRASFAPAEPFGFPGGTRLRVTLRFESIHAGHSLGAFRLAVAEDPALAPLEAGPWRQAGPFAVADGRADYEGLDPEVARLDLASRTAEGEPLWTEHPEYADGALHGFESVPGSVWLWRTLETPGPRRLAIGLGSDDAVQVWLDGERVHANPVARAAALDQDRLELELTGGRHEVLVKVTNYGGAFAFGWRVLDDAPDGLSNASSLALARPAADRSAGERDALRTEYRERHSPEWVAARDAVRALEAERTALEESLPTTLVTAERDQPRPTRLLMRGQYDQPGDEVPVAIPAVLGSLPEGVRPDRLALARWLVSDANPLTARVLANRVWQRFFGTGIVATSEDFGLQGERPSHPRLLDHLALELREGGWDLRALERRIVTSATYRQGSRITPEKLEADPYGRLLARFPRRRLDAEVLRDQALFVSDLLVERLGGPSVKPPQPIGLWKAVGYTRSNTANFVADTGDAVHRRSLYTFWKRTSPPPNLVTFDAPSREGCTVRRERTNTPLQALVLLNDPQYVECAVALAADLLRPEGDADAAPVESDDARLARAFRRVTARRPDAREREELRGLLADARAVHRDDPEGARALVASHPPALDSGLAPRELAAWTLVANVLLNLDEALTQR